MKLKARIELKIVTMMHAILHQRGPAYLSRPNSGDSGGQQLHSSTTVSLLLSWGHRGHGTSSGSAPSPSAVQKSGTRFLPTSETSNRSPAFRKALKTYVFA